MKLLASILITLTVAFSATAAPCVTDTLDNYLLLPAAGCSLGGFEFKTFTFLNVAGPAIAASDITVVPFVGPGEMGLRFESLAFTLSGGLSSTHALDYIIDAPPIIHRFDDIMDSFSFTQAGVGPAVVPPAVARVITDICATVAVVCPPGTLATITVFDDGVAPDLTDEAAVPPSNFITVQNDIILDASLGGTADFAAITNRQLLLPEPGTSVLVAAGGLLLAWWRRKRS